MKDHARWFIAEKVTLRGQSGGTGTTVIPFRSTMPKGIAPNLYRVQTSKPDEILDEFK